MTPDAGMAYLESPPVPGERQHARVELTVYAGREGRSSVRPLLLGMEWHADVPGGLNRYLAGLLSGLQDLGMAPRGAVVGPADDAGDGVVAGGRTAQALPARLLAYGRAARRAGVDANLVDAHFALYALWPVVVGRLRRLPLVVHFQGPWADESVCDGQTSGWKIRAKRRVEVALYRRAREAVVLSNAFKQVLVDGYGIAPWRVHVVPPGVDLTRFRPGDRTAARARMHLPANSPIVVAARRLVPRMGLDVLLDAWVAVHRRRPDAVLVVVGDGPQRAPLEALATRLGIASSVRFLGEVAEDVLVSCYQAADVSVVPTTALEGFGLVVLESLACGTPVIATNVGGLPEALGGLDRGLLVPPGDASALAHRLEAAFAADSSLPPPGECRRHAESFSWKAVARRHAEIYAQALHPRHDKLRVVYLTRSAQPSAGGLALLRLISALPDVDAHVILAAGGPLLDRLKDAGISAEVMPMGDGSRLSPGQLGPEALPAAGLLRLAASVPRLARRLRRLAPDLVHATSAEALLYGGLAARSAAVPVVWQPQDGMADGLPAPAARRLLRWAARRLPAAVVGNGDGNGGASCPTGEAGWLLRRDGDAELLAPHVMRVYRDALGDRWPEALPAD